MAMSHEYDPFLLPSRWGPGNISYPPEIRLKVGEGEPVGYRVKFPTLPFLPFGRKVGSRTLIPVAVAVDVMSNVTE